VLRIVHILGHFPEESLKINIAAPKCPQTSILMAKLSTELPNGQLEAVPTAFTSLYILTVARHRCRLSLRVRVGVVFCTHRRKITEHEPFLSTEHPPHLSELSNETRGEAAGSWTSAPSFDRLRTMLA
jgi:hypothetical protein